MFRSATDKAPPPPETRPPLRGLLGVAIALAVVLGLAALAAFGSAGVPLLLFALVVTLAACGLVHSYPHPVLGLCNGVTLARAAMVAFLAGALFAPHELGWVVFWVATVAFALDGLDGWLARRKGLCSPFGARFDMETDAALAAISALWLLRTGVTGGEIVLLGFMRYGFVAASLVWPVLRAPLPPAFRRKAICVVQIAALILLICPLTPPTLVWPITGIALALLSWSFLADILWLTRPVS